MASLADIRRQYPQYSDMSDAELASALHQTFYADIPAEEFSRQIGVGLTELQPASGANVRYAGTDRPVTQGQVETMQALRPNLNAETGSGTNPYWQMEPGDIPSEPGATYVDLRGNTVEPQREPLAESMARTLGRSAVPFGNLVIPESERIEALRQGAGSGFALGGKNEIVAGLSSLPDFVTGGAQKGSQGFSQRLGELDERDRELRLKYPGSYYGGAGAGAVGGALLMPELQGIKALAADAGIGGASGFLATDGSLKDRTTGAALGTVMGAGAGRLARGGKKGAGKSPTTTLDELKARSSAAYDIDATFDNKAAQALAKRLDETVSNKRRALNPDAVAFTDTARALVKEGPLTLEGADHLRSLLNDLPPREAEVVGKTLRQDIDDFIANAPMTGPDAATAPERIVEARKAWAQRQKTKAVVEALESGKLTAESGATPSKTKVVQAQRYKLRPLIDPKSPQRIRSPSPEETAALNTAVRGAPGQDLLRGAAAFRPVRGVALGADSAITSRNIDKLVATMAGEGAASSPGGLAIIGETVAKLRSGSPEERRLALAEGLERLRQLEQQNPASRTAQRREYLAARVGGATPALLPSEP